MRENHFLATFFIITNSVGYKKMMSWEQLIELSNKGNTIASHTLSHPELTAISSKQLENELSLSKKVLESRLRNHVDALCFPSGHYNTKTLEMMPKLGYKLGFTTKPGKVYSGDNPLILKRVRIPGGMAFTLFQSQFP